MDVCMQTVNDVRASQFDDWDSDSGRLKVKVNQSEYSNRWWLRDWRFVTAANYQNFQLRDQTVRTEETKFRWRK